MSELNCLQITNIDPHLKSRGTAQGIDILINEHLLIFLLFFSAKLRSMLFDMKRLHQRRSIELCIMVIF